MSSPAGKPRTYSNTRSFGGNEATYLYHKRDEAHLFKVDRLATVVWPCQERNCLTSCRGLVRVVRDEGLHRQFLQRMPSALIEKTQDTESAAVACAREHASNYLDDRLLTFVHMRSRHCTLASCDRKRYQAVYLRKRASHLMDCVCSFKYKSFKKTDQLGLAIVNLTQYISELVIEFIRRFILEVQSGGVLKLEPEIAWGNELGGVCSVFFPVEPNNTSHLKSTRVSSCFQTLCVCSLTLRDVVNQQLSDCWLSLEFHGSHRSQEILHINMKPAEVVKLLVAAFSGKVSAVCDARDDARHSPFRTCSS